MNTYRDADGEDEDWDDDEADDDGDDTDEEPTVPCPSCGREILEDSPRCPYCERYISAEDHAGPRKPLWVIATALICLAIALWWVFVAQTKGGQEITTREEVHGDRAIHGPCHVGRSEPKPRFDSTATRASGWTVPLLPQ